MPFACYLVSPFLMPWSWQKLSKVTRKMLPCFLCLCHLTPAKVRTNLHQDKEKQTTEPLAWYLFRVCCPSWMASAHRIDFSSALPLQRNSLKLTDFREKLKRRLGEKNPIIFSHWVIYKEQRKQGTCMWEKYAGKAHFIRMVTRDL